MRDTSQKYNHDLDVLMKAEIAPYASCCYDVFFRTIRDQRPIFVIADSDGDGKTSYSIMVKAYEAMGGDLRNLHFAFGPLRDIRLRDMASHSVMVSLDNYLTGDASPVLQRLLRHEPIASTLERSSGSPRGIEDIILVDHHPLGAMTEELRKHDPLWGNGLKDGGIEGSGITPRAYVIHPETTNEAPGYSTCTAVLTYQLALAMLQRHFKGKIEDVDAWHRANHWLLALGMYSDSLPRSPDTPYREIIENAQLNHEALVRLSYALNMRHVDTTRKLLASRHLGEAASRIFSDPEFQRADRVMQSWYRCFQERNRRHFWEESLGNGERTQKVVFGLLYDPRGSVFPGDLAYSLASYVTNYRIKRGRVVDYQDFDGTVIFFQPRILRGNGELVFSIEARSSDFDVGKLMRFFGGGGHVRAAGATSHTDVFNPPPSKVCSQVPLEFAIRKLSLHAQLEQRRSQYEVARS